MTTIYVWATPKLQYNICDHIFLTTFDSPYEGEPPPDSWSCFGQVHSPGSPGVRLIATLPNADVEAACRACRPNVRPADYGISFRYGLDGVGVQLANRILAAASTCKEQVELKDFRGAWLVYGVFGTYGLQNGSSFHTPQARVLKSEASPTDWSTSVVLASSGQWGEVITHLSKNPRLMHELRPRQFEELIAELLARDGLEVTLTPPQKDGGRDVLAYMNTSLGRFLFFVECKRYARDNPVGVQIVRSLYGVIEQERASAGLLVTTSRFTEPAIEFQKTIKNRMTLHEYSDLCAWLERHSGV
jgi:HJR/Mrr/RecB family endonuclease